MRKVIMLLSFVIVLSFFIGCDTLKKLSSSNLDEELQPASSILITENDSERLSSKVPIHLYFENEKNSKLKMEVRYIPIEEVKKSVNNLASVIMRELIKGPSKESALKPTIPEGTKLRSSVIINSGIATIDLSEEFITNHPGQKEKEQLCLYSIVNSLTELREIQKVKFLIDGKLRKDFKGNFKFDVPFPRSNSIIDKNVSDNLTPCPIQQEKSQDIKPAPRSEEKETMSDADELLE